MTGPVRAAVIEGPRRVEIREYPYPDVDADTGVLRVEASGIAGVDYELYEGIGAGTAIGYPFIPGHVIVGRIDAIGSDAARRWGVTEGDRVVLDNVVACGRCEPCRIGDRRRCVQRKGYGLWFDFDQPPYLWGGAAECVALHPDTELVRVPDAADPIRLCLQERLACVSNWLLVVGGLRSSESLVVLGTGMLGLCAVILGKLAGASPCIVVARPESTRRAMAQAAGADVVLSGDEEEVLDGIMAATRGRGADVVMEMTDATATRATALAVKALARRGRVLQVATKNQADMSGFSANDIIWKEATLRGVFGREHADLAFAMALLERDGGPPGMEALTAATYPLDDIEQALDTPAGSTGAVLTVVVP